MAELLTDVLPIIKSPAGFWLGSDALKACPAVLRTDTSDPSAGRKSGGSPKLKKGLQTPG